jgi:hypothetical protein
MHRGAVAPPRSLGCLVSNRERERRRERERFSLRQDEIPDSNAYRATQQLRTAHADTPIRRYADAPLLPRRATGKKDPAELALAESGI